MKIISIAYDDYANYMHSVTQALRSVGLDAECYKLIPCFTKRENEAKIITKSIMQHLEGDIVQIMHTREHLLSCLPRHKRLFVYHTGSRYRQNPDGYNKIFNKRVERTFVDIPDLFDRGAKNCVLFPCPMTIPKEIKLYHSFRPIRIGHFHLKPEVKGTHNIINIFEKLKSEGFLQGKWEFVYSTEAVSNENNLQRMNDCDIIIDLMNNKQGQKMYGAWGVTSLEAASLGKIVWSSNYFNNVYEKHYGHCPIDRIDTEDDIRRFLNYYCTIPRETFNKHQYLMKEWVEKNHSYEASGNYFKKIINGL